MCTSPIDAWRGLEKNADTGKYPIVFSVKESESHRYQQHLKVPCGACLECRQEKSRQWAMRCEHEARMHDDNCFITLTYDDKFLPEGGTLDKRDFQLFMKRLRAKYDGKRFKFFASGEYGGDLGRPHYHALLFGFDFPDKQKWVMRDSYQVYRSESLERIWGKGNTEVGSVNFESARYVAKYLHKKFRTEEEALAYYGNREPEFGLQSRGGSIKGSHGSGSIVTGKHT